MTKIDRLDCPKAALLVMPATTQYLPIRPGQQRFTLLMSLAYEWGCPWQDIAREAIDIYLLKQFPPKK